MNKIFKIGDKVQHTRPERTAFLNDTDIYTIQNITGSDRYVDLKGIDGGFCHYCMKNFVSASKILLRRKV